MNAQLASATRRAVEVKQRRAAFKRELKDGSARLSTVLRDGIPDWLGTMTAEKLLFCTPRVGVHAAVSLLDEAQLGPTQRARLITVRQRLLLADELEKIEALDPVTGRKVKAS
jgi:hypothetical protein